MSKTETKPDYNTVNEKIAERLRRFSSQLKEKNIKPKPLDKDVERKNNEEGD
jgi:hypothetical protein